MPPKVEAQTGGGREGRTEQLDRGGLDGVAAIEEVLDREEGSPRVSERAVQREVRHAVPEGGGPPGQARAERMVQAQLATQEPLGPQVRIGLREDVAHAEGAVQLVEARRTEAAIDGAAYREAVTEVKEESPARCDRELGGIGEVSHGRRLCGVHDLRL